MIFCRALIWTVLPLMLFFTGCAGFKQAYEERVCWPSGRPYEIILSCPVTSVFTQPSKSTSPQKVFFELADGPSNPTVGYLYNGIDGDLPIILIGESPSITLQKDLEAILKSYGFKIQEAKQEADIIIQGAITLLDVRSHGGLLDFKLSTKAKASFEVKVSDADGNMILDKEFHGSGEIKVIYAYLKDSQDLLGQAYCQALSDFATAIELAFDRQ